MTAPGVFYPPGASSAEDRLRFYASRFPVVEVDSTYYALPNKRTSEAWVERTPKGFVFDIKAHALMTGQPTEVNRLPKAIKEELPSELKEKKRIYRKDVPDELLDAVYGQFREALGPLIDAGKLGAVFVQFPKWVFPSNEARELILGTRQRLDLPIAVEERRADGQVPGGQQDSVRGGRRAAGVQELGPTCDRAHEPGACDLSLSRPERRELGEEEHHARRTVPLPL